MYNKGFVYFICIASAMGGLLFGYDWVVIGGAKPFYEAYFGISDSNLLQAIAMSTALLGCLVGATTAGALADRYGRKWLLAASAIIFFGSSWATGAAHSFPLFIIARLIGGVAIGLAADLAPMYIAEVAPSKVRGKLVTLNQLTIVVGILAAQIVNMAIAEPVSAHASIQEIAVSWNGMMGWRWMFYAICIPSALFLILTILIPESPRWLAQVNRNEEAHRALSRIGSKEYADQELKSYQEQAVAHAKSAAKLPAIFAPKLRKLLIIGIVIAFFQQWCGINIIFNYAQEIFQAAGYGVSDILLNIVITGVANVAFTFVAIFTVEKLGRKKLLLIGSGGLVVVYSILGACYLSHQHGIIMVSLVVLAIGLYAMSLAPITWVLLAEIFPNSVRAVAMAICTGALWLASFLLTYTFPFLNSGLGTGGTFILYALICLGGFTFIKKYITETKGKSLEQLEQELSK